MIKMVSIKRCKEILGKKYKDLSDKEIKEIREYLEMFAEIDYQYYKSGAYNNIELNPETGKPEKTIKNDYPKND